WQNWSALGAAQLASGNVGAARSAMAEMGARARIFDAHWELANLYLVTNDEMGYWQQLSRAFAVELPTAIYGSLSFVYPRALHDPSRLLRLADESCRAATSPGQCVVIRQQLLFLLIDKYNWPLAVREWEVLRAQPLTASQREDVGVEADYFLKRLIADHRGMLVHTVWSELLQNRLVPADQLPAAADRIVNGQFSAPLQPTAFGWNVCGTCGPVVAREPMASVGSGRDWALSMEMDGSAGESGVLAWQSLLLDPGTHYRLTFTAQRADESSETGLVIRVVNSEGHPCMAADLSAGT